MNTVAESKGSFHVNGGKPHPGTLTAIRDLHRLVTLAPRPDRRWSFRDAAGHFHAYSVGEDRYPTLFAREITCTSPHLDDDWWCECRTEHVCRICGELVTPGLIPGPHEETHPGLSHWEVSLVCDEGCPPLEVGSLVVVEAVMSASTRFGVAVVASVRTDSPVQGHLRMETMLAGAGPLGEVAK